jgi:hypothetical protein
MSAGPDGLSMGLYSSHRKIVISPETANDRGATAQLMVNRFLLPVQKVSQSHLSSIDDGEAILNDHCNLCGYLPAFSGQLYHPFSPGARKCGWNQRIGDSYVWDVNLQTDSQFNPAL